jgi:hypothetical protein
MLIGNLAGLLSAKLPDLIKKNKIGTSVTATGISNQLAGRLRPSRQLSIKISPGGLPK